MRYIACFGDSLIEGFPFGPECSWCKAAEQGGDFRLFNYGVCGECCDDIFWRLSRTVLPEGVEAVIFMGGANDALCGRRPDQVVRDIMKAAEFAKARGLGFALVLPLISAEAELNGALAEITKLLKQQDLYFLDLQEGVGLNPEEIARAYVDGVHPTAATYGRMGAVARRQIKNWLERGEL